MIAVEVAIPQLPLLNAALERAPAVLAKEQDAAMWRASLRVEAAVKARTPRRTGRLFSSIGSEVNRTGELDVTGRVGTNVTYAPMVERGTGQFGPKGRDIVMPAGRAMRFTVDGGTIFRRSIKGMKGRAMFREGFNEARPEIDREFGAVGRVVVGTLKVR